MYALPVFSILLILGGSFFPIENISINDPEEGGPSFSVIEKVADFLYREFIEEPIIDNVGRTKEDVNKTLDFFGMDPIDWDSPLNASMIWQMLMAAIPVLVEKILIFLMGEVDAVFQTLYQIGLTVQDLWYKLVFLFVPGSQITDSTELAMSLISTVMLILGILLVIRFIDLIYDWLEPILDVLGLVPGL